MLGNVQLFKLLPFWSFSKVILSVMLDRLPQENRRLKVEDILTMM